ADQEHARVEQPALRVGAELRQRQVSLVALVLVGTERRSGVRRAHGMRLPDHPRVASAPGAPIDDGPAPDASRTAPGARTKALRGPPRRAFFEADRGCALRALLLL